MFPSMIVKKMFLQVSPTVEFPGAFFELGCIQEGRDSPASGADIQEVVRGDAELGNGGRLGCGQEPPVPR